MCHSTHPVIASQWSPFIRAILGAATNYKSNFVPDKTGSFKIPIIGVEMIPQLFALFNLHHQFRCRRFIPCHGLPAITFLAAMFAGFAEIWRILWIAHNRYSAKLVIHFKQQHKTELTQQWQCKNSIHQTSVISVHRNKKYEHVHSLSITIIFSSHHPRSAFKPTVNRRGHDWKHSCSFMSFAVNRLMDMLIHDSVNGHSSKKLIVEWQSVAGLNWFWISQRVQLSLAM